MEKFKKRYRDLETQVMSTIRFAIMRSEYISKHINDKAIKIDYDGFTEIALINDRLTLLDAGGYHYYIYAVGLEELIDILNKHIATESKP
jgi:hypothetical protein